MNQDAAETPLDAAETPLEAEDADWLEAACLRLLLQGERVKHRFVHVRLAASWLSYRLNIDVNELLQVSVDGGDWHGIGDFYNDDDGRGCWKLCFHYAADTSLMKTAVYQRIQEHDTYLSIESKTSNQWNSMLIVRDA